MDGESPRSQTTRIDTAVRQRSPWTASPQGRRPPASTLRCGKGRRWTAILKVADRPRSHCGPCGHRRSSLFSSSSCFWRRDRKRGHYFHQPLSREATSHSLRRRHPLPQRSTQRGRVSSAVRSSSRGRCIHVDGRQTGVVEADELWIGDGRVLEPVVDVSLVPLRSKLQALLMMLYSQSGDVDPAALEAKLRGVAAVAGLRIGTVDGTP